jgi:hypothetical protein
VLEDLPLETLRPFIDWTPFFHTWELKGVFPRILEHEKYGEQARQIFAEGNALLDRMIKERSIRARGVYGFFRANAVGDDVELPGAGGWVGSRSPPGLASRRSAIDFEPSTTTTTRSWPRRWPTGWRRRSPSTCTSASAKSGATAAPRG